MRDLVKKHWFLVSFGVLLSVFVHGYHLFGSVHPSGWDGYYYVMQIDSVLQHGQMQSSDYSLIYPFLLVFTLFTSNVIVVFKVGVLVLIAGFLVTLALVFKGKPLIYLALLFIAAVFSPSLTYIAAQYSKNLLGLIFLVLYFKNYADRRYVWIVIFFGLTFFTHRMTAGIALLFFPLIFIKTRKSILVLVLVGALALMLIGVTLFPGVLHLADFERFHGEFNLVPSFAPFAFLKTWDWSLSIWWYAEVVIQVLSLGLLTGSLIREKALFNINSLKPLLFWLFVLLWFPFFKMDQGTIGYRFYLISLVLTPLLLFYAVESYRLKFSTWILIPLAVMAISSFKSYDKDIFEPNWNKFNRVALKTIDELKSKKVDLVIAHQGMAELIIIYSEMDALNWSPSSELDFSKVWRLATGIEYYDLSKYLEKKDLSEVVRIDLDYYLIREDVWKLWLEQVEVSQDNELLGRVRNPLNPERTLPNYLKK